MSNKKYIKFVLPLITLAWIAFIWSRSVMNGVDSADESTTVLYIVQRILAHLPTDVGVTDHIIRKLAHYSEFAILGFLLGADVALLTGRVWRNITIPMLLGLLTALTDETIQLFSLGRSSMVADVWIDFAGVVTGIAVLVLIWGVTRFFEKKRGKKL
jgi:VanZ family protein